jgi:hypothetical protein
MGSCVPEQMKGAERFPLWLLQAFIFIKMTLIRAIEYSISGYPFLSLIDYLRSIDMKCLSKGLFLFAFAMVSLLGSPRAARADCFEHLAPAVIPAGLMAFGLALMYKAAQPGVEISLPMISKEDGNGFCFPIADITRKGKSIQVSYFKLLHLVGNDAGSYEQFRDDPTGAMQKYLLALTDEEFTALEDKLEFDRQDTIFCLGQ